MLGHEENERNKEEEEKNISIKRRMVRGKMEGRRGEP
jgi:hypothetical protein